ncbi:MAG: hypothetical protein K5873_06300 [Treponema sp.]|nr:hypothetical protein [Treponema sp.]
MKGKKSLFILIFLLISAFTFAQPFMHRCPPQRGRGMGENQERFFPRSENFSLIGVKCEDSGKDFTISLYFNGPVDANSLANESIFIQDLPLPEESEFLFNKNRFMARFTIPRQEGEFSIRLMNISSFNRNPMPTIELKNLEANTFLKFSREEHKWEKSSL